MWLVLPAFTHQHVPVKLKIKKNSNLVITISRTEIAIKCNLTFLSDSFRAAPFGILREEGGIDSQCPPYQDTEIHQVSRFPRVKRRKTKRLTDSCRR